MINAIQKEVASKSVLDFSSESEEEVFPIKMANKGDGEISIKGLSFAYSNSDHYLFKSLNLEFAPGEAISLDPNQEDVLLNSRSDGTLIVYNSSFNAIAKIFFKDMFPVSLTSVPFSANTTDINYIMATATFKYTIFNVETLTKDES